MVSKTTIKHKILLVGSGLMTPPLVDYLTSFNDTHITVASNIIKDAENLCKRAPGLMNAAYLDVSDVS
jgi:alpha-aminoadipic semialdehyde synthase